MTKKLISPEGATNLPNFEWPAFKNDRERIKYNTEKYKNFSIVEAFNDGLKLTLSIENEVPTPVSLKLGDEFDVKIKSISKSGVTFENLSAKELVVCKNNLNKYKNISPDIYNLTLTARVVDVNKHQVTVDVIQPMFDSWINRIMKDPTNQYDVVKPELVTVRNLQLSKNGYIGKAVIPSLSNLLGEDFEVDAFIPGSHIVLNIEKDFEKWNGKDVQTFVSNFINKPNSLTQKSLVCSRKNYLTYLGDLNKISIFDLYCKQDEQWESFKKTSYAGKVTGVINSSKKCGVFVEITQLNITGMVNMKPEEIVKYNPGQEIFVRIADFEDMIYFDDNLGQRTHLDPYKIEDGKLRKCILKPVLELA